MKKKFSLYTLFSILTVMFVYWNFLWFFYLSPSIYSSYIEKRIPDDSLNYYKTNGYSSIEIGPKNYKWRQEVIVKISSKIYPFIKKEYIYIGESKLLPSNK